MESYIEDKKNLYALIHEFLEESDEPNDDDARKKSFQKLINLIKSHQIEGDPEEICQFLEIIKRIGKHHHRDQYFKERLNQLLLHYKDQIKQTLSNLEIFNIFQNNKNVVLFLLQNDIITISEEIYNAIVNKIEKNSNRYCHFFIPELENFVGEEKMNFLKNELLKDDPNFFTNYEARRSEGENDSYICSLIRQDSAEEFIAYVNRRNISPSSEILPSIFETNPFLIYNKNTTLIEYSAFFGSLQIFRYLLINNAKLTPSLWLYAIHSKNAELIHLIESNEVPPPKNYEQCLIESIKCHHNDIARYIEDNYFDQKESQLNEEITSNCIKYHNYSYFRIDTVIKHGFFYLRKYHYDKLFDLLLKENEKMIEKKLIQYPNIKTAAENNEVEIIYHYLLEMQEISEELFSRTKIKQIVIPSSVRSIKESAFIGCTSLRKIIIPSSVTSFGNDIFYGIEILEIAGDIKYIPDCLFRECKSLAQITINSSVTSIGESAFYECSSLAQITIPSSVTSIGESAFSGCSSLTQITIPSSVTSIGSSAFEGCSSLTQISIPSSLNSIGIFFICDCPKLDKITIIPCDEERIAFYKNKFLLFKSNPMIDNYDTFVWTKDSIDIIKIPEFIKVIGNGSFCGYSSLREIQIPYSVTSIGHCAFKECSSLIQITIPSSVTSIGNKAFSECSSLTEITIPSSVTSIGDSAFENCSSLTEITIPSSVKSIGDSAFRHCKDLYLVEFENNNPSIEIIPEYLFDGCISLEYVALPDSIIEIENFAFNCCTSLLELKLPPSLTYLEKFAFEGCKGLQLINNHQTSEFFEFFLENFQELNEDDEISEYEYTEEDVYEEKEEAFVNEEEEDEGNGTDEIL